MNSPYSPAGTTPCGVCMEAMPIGAQKCTKCSSWQDKPCLTCMQRMPPGARRCNGCATYTNWLRRSWGYVGSGRVLLLALITVITTAILPLRTYFSERDSHTVIKVTGSDASHVYVKVWNTGRKPSALVGYRLMFDGLRGSERELELDEDEQRRKSVIEPQKEPVTIGLSPPKKQDVPEAKMNIQCN